jgi:ribosome-binding factor A
MHMKNRLTLLNLQDIFEVKSDIPRYNSFFYSLFAEVLLPRSKSSAVSRQVLCMAHPRRVARVAKQIEREVGSLLIYDKVLQQAICPERKRGMDGALSALASVTDVQISNDLQVAKVYLSIYSDDAGKEAAIVGLQRLEGYVRKHVGKAVRLRLTPEIRFIMDESIERTERMFKLLEQVRAIEAGEAPPPPIAIATQFEDEEDDDNPFTTVDLGMFDDGENSDDDDDDDDASTESRGVFNLIDTGKSSKSGKEFDLNNEEVEEMMALFKQESNKAGNRGGGTGRGGNRRGGGGRGGGSGGRRK